MITSATAREIALALAGRQARRLANGGWLTRCPVPTHGAGKGDLNPSLAVSNGDGTVLVKCFAGCDSRDVLEELRRLGWVDRGAHRPRPTPASTSFASNENRARKQREKASRPRH